MNYNYPPSTRIETLNLVLSGEAEKGEVSLSLGNEIEARGVFQLQLSESEIKAALDSASFVSQAYPNKSSEIYDPLRKVGRQLFHALFEGRLRSAYQRALQWAEQQHKVLRLHLKIASEPLVSLPWEFLCDERVFLALSARTPLVRTWADAPTRWQPPQAGQPLRVLLLDVNDPNAASSDQAAKMLAQLKKRYGAMQVTDPAELNVQSLADLIGSAPFDLVYYTGATIEDEKARQKVAIAGTTTGGTNWIDADELIYLLLRNKELRLVFFDANYTDQLAAAVARQGVAAVGVRSSMTEPARTHFTHSMFEHLLAGDVLDNAVTAGRQQVDAENPGTREWGLPVYYHPGPPEPLVAAAIPAKSVSASLEFNAPEASSQLQPDVEVAWKKIQSRLTIQQLNLENLKSQAAAFPGQPPAGLAAQLQEKEAEVARLQDELKNLTERNNPTGR